MSRVLIFFVLLATFSTCLSLKKDKFKIKAKGFGLKNLKIPPPEAPAPVAAPAPAPAPYYPPPPAPAPAPAPYYPQPAPAAPAPYYPPSPVGYGAAAAKNAVSSAGIMAATSASSNVVPVMLPVTLISQPQMAAEPLMHVSEPLTQVVSALSAPLSEFGSVLSTKLAAHSKIPRVDYDYVIYSEPAPGPVYSYSVLRDSASYTDGINPADQQEEGLSSRRTFRSGYRGYRF